MDDYFLSERKRLKRFLDLGIRRDRFKGVKSTKINILITIILAVSAGLFFSSYLPHFARADQPPTSKGEGRQIDDPLSRISTIKKNNLFASENEICLDQKGSHGSSRAGNPREANKNSNQAKYMNLVRNYPMADMVPYIAQRDPRTASFLVAIAKKESDWGVHVPVDKNGRDCYNYWGYKGGYNLTDSGYSCFDSPEQAVSMVGDRIEQLIEKNIDTPQKMVVWKCGGGCASDANAGSWISTVSGFFYKLVS